jgi:hypothetical protein
MGEFLHIISSFPTLPLTVGLGVVVCYWAFALVTGSAFEHGDGIGDSVGGAVKGAGDAVAGAVKGAGEAALGAVKGIGHGVHGGHAEGQDHGHAEDGGLLTLLGVGKIPVTITMSVAALFGWTICALACVALAPGLWLTQGGIFLGSIVGGLLTAALALRPVSRAFDDKPTRSRDAVGQVCVITSGKVDATFGTATVADGGAGLNVLVRCEKPNQLKKGERAVVVDFDAEKNVYEIEPVDWLLPEEVQALDDPNRAAQIISSRIRNR